jgi:hypothetical protein
MNQSEIQIYTTHDGRTEIEVRLNQDTVWLSQKQMAHLFEKDIDTIGLHLKNIYQTGELDDDSTTEDSSVVQKEGKRYVLRRIKLYNLDAIISVGYRVNSKRGIQFRIWANRILKEYLIKGYALNQTRLTQQNEQLKELRESVKILGNVISREELSGNESLGLLNILLLDLA